ncbi:caskin-1-like isoform X2 [Stylophora pistillata]|uniref:caskin-1-like isoform X2 n=1 Tax=Stylophora pistillata TaxID=50429 RepID=UPI000C044289|nr:caskin-1-like isoform X2 [Stylophora pistillata]
MPNLSFGGPRDRPRGSICEPMTQTTMARRVMLIHQLVLKGDLKELKKEIAKDIDLLEGKNSEGMTPLFQATSNNNLECVQFLVTSGANIDARDNVGRTPVALAAYQGWHDGLYYLLAKGANCLIADNDGRLPLHAATYFSNEKSLEVLLQHLSFQDVDVRDNEGMTALHWAAFHGRTGHVRLLVEKKADLLSRDTDGKLPLHWAAQNGYVSTCQVMLEMCEGHNLVNGKDFSGRSPIHLSAAAGQYCVLVELTAVPFANIVALDNDGRTPLHWAAATGHAYCVAHLLRLESDKEAEDKHGGTPLQYAQQGHHSACCQLLMAHDPSNPLATEVPLIKESPVEILPVPGNSRHGSDGVQLFNQIHNGVTNGFNSQLQTDCSDSEVQEILGDSTTAVQVFVEMNGDEEDCTEADFLHPSLNGECDAGGYRSEEDSRYPPQMALTPIPASPVPPEEGNHGNPTRPPILPRFSFEDQVPIVRPSGAPVPALAPIKSKTMPERLRLDNYKSTPLKPVEMKPPSPSTEALLAPLKIAKAKQNPVPMNTKTQLSSPTTSSPGEAGTPDCNDMHWARKGKLKADTLTLTTVSDNLESDLFRKLKDKRPSATGTAGQMLPTISDKPSHVTQVQGSRQDQLEAKKKHRRRTSKNHSIPEDLDLRDGFVEENVEDDTKSSRSIGNLKEKPKKKKKVRKVMSWNF